MTAPSGDGREALTMDEVTLLRLILTEDAPRHQRVYLAEARGDVCTRCAAFWPCLTSRYAAALTAPDPEAAAPRYCPACMGAPDPEADAPVSSDDRATSEFLASYDRPDDAEAAAPQDEMAHDLKVWPPYFDALADGSKTFEVRRDDRNIQPGDLLRLREWEIRQDEPLRYSGREVSRLVTYVLRGSQAVEFGVQDGYCVVGLAPASDPDDLVARLAAAEASLAKVRALRSTLAFDGEAWIAAADVRAVLGPDKKEK